MPRDAERGQRVPLARADDLPPRGARTRRRRRSHRRRLRRACSRRSSRARARRRRGTRPSRSAASAARLRAERGKRSQVSSRFETPKKRLVSSGPIGASESVDGRTSIETAYASEQRDEREPEARPVAEDPRAENAAGDGAEPEERDAAGAASPAGNQPCTRFIAIAVPNADRRAAREEEREEDEEREHEHGARHRRSARDFDLVLEAVRRRDGAAVALPVERVRRLQRGARDVGDRDEARDARQARGEQAVVAARRSPRSGSGGRSARASRAAARRRSQARAPGSRSTA